MIKETYIHDYLLAKYLTSNVLVHERLKYLYKSQQTYVSIRDEKFDILSIK